MDNYDLIKFINKAVPDKLQVEEELGFGFVRLNITEAQKRQAKDDIRCVEDAVVELLRNSRDANANKIRIATFKHNTFRTIVIIDNGDGIPENVQDKVFEPRVTSKLDKINYDSYGLHGRGMALYSIRINSEEAAIKFSKQNKGTALRVVFDTSKVKEKVNQSSWPKFDNKGKIKEGANNIIRRCMEFNLAHQNIDIKIGTPAQILQSIAEQFDLKEKRSANKFYEFSKIIGLELSYRNAQRVFYSEIEEPKSLLSSVETIAKKNNKNSLIKSNAYFTKVELQSLLKTVINEVDEKGKQYFIKVSDNANINKVGNVLKIDLPLESED